ncbi:MAG: helix-turn-helix transcriptional regulator [Planctomycetes bacterium]|nr:helix-turn-helix transcriptional regulator [Planctomycetota bacterium]
MGRTKPFDEQLREIVRKCGRTQYRIAKETSIDESALSKFMRGERGLSMSAINALVAYLNLVVKQKEK